MMNLLQNLIIKALHISKWNVDLLRSLESFVHVRVCFPDHLKSVESLEKGVKFNFIYQHRAVKHPHELQQTRFFLLLCLHCIAKLNINSFLIYSHLTNNKLTAFPTVALSTQSMYYLDLSHNLIITLFPDAFHSLTSTQYM